MIYMYVLDSAVLRKGVSDELFQKQWEVFQSRVTGRSVGPVPYKTVSHFLEDAFSFQSVEDLSEQPISSEQLSLSAAETKDSFADEVEQSEKQPESIAVAETGETTEESAPLHQELLESAQAAMEVSPKNASDSLPESTEEGELSEGIQNITNDSVQTQEVAPKEKQSRYFSEHYVNSTSKFIPH